MQIKTSIPVWLLATVLFFVSCNQSDDGMRVAADPGVLAGEWRVERFQEGAVNETSSFSAIRFRFADNGNFVVLQNGSDLTQGTWRLSDGNRILDIDVPEFRNEEQAAARFGDDVYEIHDDWDVLEFSSNRMRIKSGTEEFILVR